MMTNTVFYYSGTGNCLACAKQIAGHFGMEVKPVTRESAEYPQNINCDFCVLVIPSYAYGMPATVRKFIKANSFSINYLAVVTTYGSFHGGILAEAARLFKRKNQTVHFSYGVKAVENYVPVFGYTKQPVITKKTENQRTKTEELIGLLENRKQNKRHLFRPFSSFVSTLFRIFTPLLACGVKVKSGCNACGLCRRICPARAISLKENKNGVLKPKIRKRSCDHCQSCLHICPKKAVRFFRITKKSPRYLHPDINVAELIKRD